MCTLNSPSRGIETDSEQAYRVLGVSGMKLSDRMGGIDANLDDVQSGMEACSRAAAALHLDSTKFNGNPGASLLRSVVLHVNALMASARDQRMALQALRENIVRLQEELTSHEVVRPPPSQANRQARRSFRVRSR
jgi:hypothetical protein